MAKCEQLVNKLYIPKEKTKILIFMLYKKTCDILYEKLLRNNWPVTTINGDKTQSFRDLALSKFKSGECPILVATDVASRGLDIKDVKYVINVEFPLRCEDYVHRIGRTGRAGETGIAYTFFSKDEKEHARELVSILNQTNQVNPPQLSEIASTAPGIKPKKTALVELYGDFAKGRGGMQGKTATRVFFDN
eukprot:TRINITY_DN12182_c0_g1_i1.p1 TRINITY_DN12182_c0_g1~~TRINITY_DN12182_c0_g1_i1.p1  ORF type:complete len:200 (-),score=48.53 TRINITY_DN12182_c0_g1_i1:212-784(-)